MQKSGESLVEEIEILNPYNTQDFLDEKLSIVDIKARNEMEEWFIIEMQVNMNASFPKRILYYWAKTYHRLLTHGNKKGLKDRENKKKKRAFGFAYFKGTVKRVRLKVEERKEFHAKAQRRQGEKNPGKR